MIDQAYELRRLVGGLQTSPGPRCRTIAITSGKGGVGKTNIAVNLGLAMAEAGARVMLVDADFGLSNVDVILGISPRRDLRHVLDGTCDMEDIVCDAPLGLSVIPGASGIADLANMPAEQRDRLMLQIARISSQTDIMLVDTAPGISDSVVDLAGGADEALVVTTPEPTSLTDSYAFVKVALARYPEARLSLIVNMATDRKQAEDVASGFGKVVRRFLGRDIRTSGFVCADSRVIQAVHSQSPFLLSQPRSVAANCVRRLGRDLLDNLVEPVERMMPTVAFATAP